MKKSLCKNVMKIVFSGMLLISSMLMTIPQSVYAEEIAEQTGAWTIALYMCGSDLESRSAAASNDLLEILQAENMPKDVTIVVETGGSLKWFFKEAVTEYYQNELGLSETEIEKIVPEEISSDYIQRYKVNYYHEYVTDEQTIETCPALELLEEKVAVNNPDAAQSGEAVVSMGETDTLQEFLTYVKNRYPATHYAMEFWNHGAGPANGVCADSNAGNDILELDELQSAFAGSQKQSAGKFDVIGFDACLMSSYEVWTVLAPYAEYGVGSMTNEPGDGWYYTPFLEELGAHSADSGYTGADFSKAIVKSYEEYYKKDGICVTDRYNGDMESAKESIGDAMLSCYDLKKVASTSVAFDNLADTLLYLSEDTTGMQKMLDTIYDTSVVEKGFEVVGMQSFLKETAEYARKRSKELKNSAKSYERNLAEKYSFYQNQADNLASSLFSGAEAATLASYDGWEGGEHETQAPMSLYFPLTGTGQYGYIDYTGSKYPLLEISSQYARLVYKIAAGIEKKQYEEIDTNLTWNAEQESYQYTVDKEQAPYVNAIGMQRYMMVGDAYYLVEKAESKDPAFYEVKPDTVYTVFNGVPCASEVYWEEKEYTIFSMECLVNGEYAVLYYIDDGQEVYLWYYDYDEMIAGDEHFLFQVGDTITPIAVVSDHVAYYNALERANKSKVMQEAVYTVKTADMRQDENGEYTVLPIKKETMDSSKLNYAFFTFTNALDKNQIKSYCDVVNHQEILDFAAADISIEKAEFEVSGDPIIPAVTVAGTSKKYKEGRDYELIYENNLGKGTASVTIAGLGQFHAVPNVKKEFSIVAASVKEVTKEVVKTEVVEKEVVKTEMVPQEVVKEVEKEVTKVVTVPGSVKNVSVKRKNKKIMIKYKKNDSVQYQIAYSTKKSGKKKILGSTEKTSYTIKNADKKKMKYIYVRAYITVDGKNYFGTWGKGKQVK